MSGRLTLALRGYLEQARNLERLDLDLLERAERSARDAQVRTVYTEHRAETLEHMRLIEEQLLAHSDDAGADGDRPHVGALEIEFVTQDPYTPLQIALSAYAVESLEIAVYHLLRRLAECCEEPETARVAGAILEQEEQAAELMAATFDRAVAVTLQR